MKRLPLVVVVVTVLAALLVAGTVSAAPLGQYTPDLCTGGTASASEEWSPGTAPPSEAFDDDLTSASYWANNAASSGLPDWIAYDLGDGNAAVVAAYRIFFTNQDSSFNSYIYSPDTWEFQGSNDGSNWDTLDNQSGQTWTANEWKQYTISNTTAYRHYRLYVTYTQAAYGWLAIHEIEMLGLAVIDPTATPVATTESVQVYVNYPTPVPQYFDPTANAGDGPEPWLLRFYVGVFATFAFTYVLFRLVDTHQFYLLFMALCMGAAWVTKSVNGAAVVYLLMLVMVLSLKLWGSLQSLLRFGK